MDEVPVVALDDCGVMDEVPVVVVDDCGTMEELWPVEDSGAMDWLGTAPYCPWAATEPLRRARREVARMCLKYMVRGLMDWIGFGWTANDALEGRGVLYLALGL